MALLSYSAGINAYMLQSKVKLEYYSENSSFKRANHVVCNIIY
jgi:hypothetical protein